MSDSGKLLAKRSDRTIRPMPEKKKQLSLKRVIDLQEYEMIKQGFVPEGMDDKWFIFMEGDWLYFYRSWTGLCVYTAKLAESKSRYQITEAWVNDDPEEYKSYDEEYESALLEWLIDRFLLGKDLMPPRLKNPPWGA